MNSKMAYIKSIQSSPVTFGLISIMTNYLRATTERVKHVKEHKARERHGGVTWCDDIVSHLKRKPKTVRKHSP